MRSRPSGGWSRTDICSPWRDDATPAIWADAGHTGLTGLLSYTPQGGIESTAFLVLVAIAFALSTDYGVFLLTRIKEARDSGIPDREAVAVGLQRSGKIVTAASVLLAVAIGAFVTSKLIFLKQLGVGAAIAVLVDAFIVRALLVPSLMALLGRWNWWQPRVLRRLHARIEVREGGVGPRAPGPTTADVTTRETLSGAISG